MGSRSTNPRSARVATSREAVALCTPSLRPSSVTPHSPDSEISSRARNARRTDWRFEPGWSRIPQHLGPVRNDGVGWYAGIGTLSNPRPGDRQPRPVPSYEGTCIPVDDRRRDTHALGRRSVAQRAPLASPRGARRPTLSRMTERYWRAAEPKSLLRRRDRGAGGHGLATAYYLAANHGITDVCVVEKGWLGGGNMARNTTIIRSNYLWDESAAIYEHSLKLWEGLEETLSCRHAVLPARRPEPGPRPGRHPHLQAPRLRQRAQRGRRRMARRRRGQGVRAHRERLAGRAIPGPRRHAATPRGRRAPRQGRGWFARGPTAWASTSSNTPRSPDSYAVRAARSKESRLLEAASRRGRWRWRPPATPASSHPWWTCGCPCSRTRASAGERADMNRCSAAS